MKEYQKLITQIALLPWNNYNPESIIYLSWVSAVEFAKSLRVTLELYKDNQSLIEMAKGELKTDNLAFNDYARTGDHHEFLLHFLNKDANLQKIDDKIYFAGKDYLRIMDRWSSENRAMTVFSREQELPVLFRRISGSYNWNTLGLGYYRYYLDMHVALDSTEGGHGDLTKDFELDDGILYDFWQIRLNLYESLKK